MTFNYRILTVESERGWGQTYEYENGFMTLEEARARYNKINSLNTSKTAPDWYFQAEHIEEFDHASQTWKRVK